MQQLRMTGATPLLPHVGHSTFTHAN